MLRWAAMATILPLLLYACASGSPEKDTHERDTTDESRPPDDSGGGPDSVAHTAVETGETAHTGGESGESGESGGDSDTSGATWSDAPAVVLFIGDGMGYPHVAGGGVYSTGTSGSLTLETLPYQGRLRTASLSGITDSAAAATVYATGTKTYNSWLGLDRDRAEVETLLDLAAARGMATGVVSTDTLTGATPAAFLVHVSNRGDTDEIAAQEVAGLPDVLLGGGSGTLLPLLEGADIQLLSSGAELDAAVVDDRPLVGLFASNTFPWVYDGYTAEPTLAQMTTAALSQLEARGEGYFVIIEGARIDHASHGQSSDRVHPETESFDEAIAAALAFLGDRPNTTLVVTADHECGGMIVSDTGTPGETPETSWRWGKHTNSDVPVFGMGERASVLHGERLDSLWVHEVLSAAIEERDVEEPAIVPLVDGWLDDMDPAVTTQTWDTSFGASFNQLDAMRVGADEDGLKVGVDGVFDREENVVVVLVDLDFGDGTGLGAEGAAAADSAGALEELLGALDLELNVDGLGFDLGIVTVAATEVEIDDLSESAGLRGLREPWAYDSDLWWLPSIVNFDDGNVAIEGEAAPDAGATGLTEHGMEVLFPWTSLWPDGLPSEGQSIAVVALLVNGTASWASNQALPPLSSEDEPADGPIPIDAVVLLEVDADGLPVGEATVAP